MYTQVKSRIGLIASANPSAVPSAGTKRKRSDSDEESLTLFAKEVFNGSETARVSFMVMTATASATTTTTQKEIIETQTIVTMDQKKEPLKHIVYDSLFSEHTTGKDHPESNQRCEVIMKALLDAFVTDEAHIIFPRQATSEELQYCHTPEFIALVRGETCALSDNNETLLSTGDVVICPRSYEVALHAAGAILTGIDRVISGEARSVFCNARPPGHHACLDEGMGFCIFNNVAIGARYLQKKYAIERVLIVDWDVHHGNGTQEIFYEDPSVFYFSTHQKGIYPNTRDSQDNQKGRGGARDTNLNVPINEGKDSAADVINAFKLKLVPAMKKFKPQFVLISAGFDGHELDPLGNFNLKERDFKELTEIVVGIANEYAEGRVVSILEGGYNLEALKGAVVAHVQALP